MKTMNDERGTMNEQTSERPVHRSSFIVHRSPKRSEKGFTLIELIVVVTIIGILAGVAVVQVKYAQQKAREAALRHDLSQLRKGIDDFYADKQKYPENLEALKTAHYLRAIPKDPITMQADWEEVPATVDPTGNDPNAIPVDPTATDTSGGPAGIIDVHSNAQGNGLDGTPYKSW
jgi:prepilin-type N-terminal cleavage/methylation domain-containing protein